MSVLICENLTIVDKDKVIIDNFSFNFLDNKIYAIVGNSESGKDVLLDLITSRMKSDQGEVYLDGEILQDNPKMGRRLCYITPNISFPGHLNIKNIFKIMQALYPKWDNAYAYELSKFFNLKPRDKYHNLDIDRIQLLNGIIGLASRANITVFSMPLVDVDPKDRSDFFNFMYSHHLRYPRTIIITTDFIDEIESIYNRVLFFDKGRIFESFTLDDIKNDFRLLSGKSEVLKSLISGVKIIGMEERYNMLTVCVAKRLTKDDTRKYQKYLIKISEATTQKVFIYLLNLREAKGI